MLNIINIIIIIHTHNNMYIHGNGFVYSESLKLKMKACTPTSIYIHTLYINMEAWIHSRVLV